MRLASHATRPLRRRLLLISLVVLNCSSASPPCEAQARVARSVTATAALPRQTQEEDVSQPSTTPLPRKKPARLKKFARGFLDVLICRPAKYRKELELARYGPQFPEDYDPRDFYLHAFVKGGWPVNLIYELGPQSTLTVTVRLMGVRPFTTTFPPAAADEVRGFILPPEFGRAPQAGVISFRANTDISGGKSLADFQLLAFDIGGSTIPPAVTTRPARADGFRLKAASYAPRPPLTPPSTDTVSIYDVSMASRGAGRSALVDFSFKTRNTNGRWEAEFQRVVQQHTTASVAEIPFDVRISRRDNPIRKSWDGSLRRRGRARPGLYQVWIKAWWGPFDGGQSAAARESRPRRIDW